LTILALETKHTAIAKRVACS